MPISQSVKAGLGEGRASSRTGADGIARFAFYGGLGGLVGFFVALLEWVTMKGALELVLEAPLWLKVLSPGLGLVVANIILRLAWRSDSSTSDSFVSAFHTPLVLSPKQLGPKLAAAVATIGSGGALGLEGPSVLLGSTIGQWMDARRLKFLGNRGNRRIMLVAGAAAGVAAVFRAPATGVLFALEAPYRRDIARHALIPALVASSMSYIVFVFLLGSERLLDIKASEFSLTGEVLGAIVLGVVAGGTARLLAMLFHFSKELPERFSAVARLPVVAATLGICVLITDALVEMPLTLGPAAVEITEFVLDPTVSVGVVVALFVLRALATSATLSGGGVGGVFVPLVVQGLLMGRVVGMLFDSAIPGLYPVLGLAAVLGAGYRTPLAAVMFVAETTGRAEFVIPALIATAVSQAVMGEMSVSAVQKGERQGHLEERLALPVDDVTIEDPGTLLPTDSLLGVVDQLGPNSTSPAVPVADPMYCGLLVLHDIAAALHDHGLDATVGDAMREIPALALGDPAVEAARIMSSSDTAAVAVVDADGFPVGVVTVLSLTGLADLGY